MEELNFGYLNQLVANHTKPSYAARMTDGKLTNNIANFGGAIGDIATVSRNGEYHGLSVEIKSAAPKLITDYLIKKTLKLLEKDDYSSAVNRLGVTTIDELIYCIHMWLSKATNDYDGCMGFHEKNYPELLGWIHASISDPLSSIIEIHDIGCNTNTKQPVVPQEWAGKIFGNGAELHAAMNKLESRLNKPPVTYAVTNGMHKKTKLAAVTDISGIELDWIIYLDFDGRLFHTEFREKSRNIGKYSYVIYGKIAIGFVISDILEPKISAVHSRQVGMLVSRMQKSIRTGRYGSKALISSIRKLNECQNYNLPEHGYMRVSASKQLVWRLYISILEDVRPYLEKYELSHLHLILLALITQKLLEYKFTSKVLRAILFTGILAQYNDDSTDMFDWRSLPQTDIDNLYFDADNDFKSSIFLAISNIPMMSGDKKLLQKYYSLNSRRRKLTIPEKIKNSQMWNKLNRIGKIYHNDITYNSICARSYDQHTNPYIIIYYQACHKLSKTTKQISGYIWDVSSSYNVRNLDSELVDDEILSDIQEYLMDRKESAPEPTDKIDVKRKYMIAEQPVSSAVARQSFLLLFGIKYKCNGVDTIICGSKSSPTYIRKGGKWVNISSNDTVNAYPDRTVNLEKINAPRGYVWVKKKVDTKIVKSRPYVDGKKIKYFDGSSLIKSIKPITNDVISSNMYEIIIGILSGEEIGFGSLIKFRHSFSKKLLDWSIKKSDLSKVNMPLVKSVYTKLFNTVDGLLTIGPVSRSGAKLQYSIDYLLEGKIWAVCCILSYLYPNALVASGPLNFKVNVSTPDYAHMTSSLESIIFSPRKIDGPIPLINTKLWDHQLDSVKKIRYGFDKNIYGFGDASDVGAGKTLTALKLATLSMEKTDRIYCGVLVLLPGPKLIKTWLDEIEKHTTGFDVIKHENTCNVGKIKRNTIVISTMARSRDHPIHNNWALLVIDECLTVQNKCAMWTEKTWIQSRMSKNLIMMSATFFRARFDKLYYMLKMLQTGIPEKREYLDTILLESIVSQVSSIKRKWVSNIHRFEMPKNARKKYEKLSKLELNDEAKYAKLDSFLVKDQMVIDAVSDNLSELLKSCQDSNRRCLIYARSNTEAKIWSETFDVPIYPDKSRHCIVTYNDGTYGLNDLVQYDTIIMRPPSPDKLPQIKGRLDRPGQESDVLHVEYFILGDTIEEGLLLRMNIASNFIKKYIMPLSKFYALCNNHRNYKDE